MAYIPKNLKFPEFKANYNLEGRGVYFVVNDGGTRDIEITQCRAFFVEWDDRPKKDQLFIYNEKNLQNLPSKSKQGRVFIIIGYLISLYRS